MVRWRWLILVRNSMSTSCGHGIAGCEPGWELAPSLLCRCWRFCFSSSTRSFFFFFSSHYTFFVKITFLSVMKSLSTFKTGRERLTGANVLRKWRYSLNSTSPKAHKHLRSERFKHRKYVKTRFSWTMYNVGQTKWVIFLAWANSLTVLSLTCVMSKQQ